MEIKDKKIIVTGGANGIGKELVKQLLQHGAYVWAVDINDESLQSLERELHSERLETFIVDVSNKDSIDIFKEKYINKWEYVDILINNAGIVQPFITTEKLDDETINRVMNVNFYGPLNLTRAFLNSLRTREEAYIVNLSSMGGFFPFPKQTIYGASKAALKLFTEGLYAELLDTSVKVMIVFPGAIATNILKNSNVELKSSESSSYKMLSPDKAASIIIKGITKNKFKLFVGSDAKFMKFLYKLNSKSAIKTINNKMKNIN
ncbi:MAG TPA: SDR family NAD(P)-dependent oxidoreductase [Bacilli bacterium]|nr:SDR family NAD(P)-dependent oxidoreductase [Bacilli bacterium]